VGISRRGQPVTFIFEKKGFALLVMLPPPPAPLASPEAAEPAQLVNKKELAALLGCALPTIAAWVDRYPDFPVQERGTNGRQWLFDPSEVRGFLLAKREAEQTEADERNERLKQFALPGLDQSDETGTIKATDLLAMARVRALQRQEQREAGLLVPTSDVRMALTSAFTRLNRALSAMLGQLARKHGWGEVQLRDARTMLHEMQRVFVRDAGSFAPADPLGDDGMDLFGTDGTHSPETSCA
jgi:phage terminase Nu1 subunit (DNA packaging protein)